MISWLRFEEPLPLEEWRNLVLRDGSSVPVRWVRDKRARRLRLMLGEKGVRLTLPRTASVRLAETFLFENRDWLAEQLARLPPVDTRPFGSEDRELRLRGEALPIDWREGRFLRVERTDATVTITRTARSSDKQLRAAMRAFYQREAEADVGRWLPAWSPGLPRPPASLRFRALSSLWGSLSATDALMLDLALVLGRPSAFEYVLVHELCHLIHRDHSRRFWREVEARCPQWREERDYLHGEGLALKGGLRRFYA
ncbi:M48 family metallopeptidase [Arenimonas sp.]|uniref:M48 family metallopeptidase n=1 Tax=Arenimonas sp. TaxID=1872635 RepID=UPI0039E310C7